jgi:hypothetical protein
MDYDITTLKRLFLLLLVCLMLVACEAQATPISGVQTPTATTEPMITLPLQIRYGLYANVLGFVQDLDILQASALVEAISAENAIPDYDVVVAYGIYDGWQQSPVKQHVSLIINPNLVPLDDENISNIVRQLAYSLELPDIFYIPKPLPPAIQSVTEAKTALANVGYPDGFVLTMAVNIVPALEAIAAQFTERNIDLHIIESESDVLAKNRAHLILALWTEDAQRTAWIEQVGEQNVVDLFTLPISYLASDELHITFTEYGWPVPAR